jgi:hypothetical protein
MLSDDEDKNTSLHGLLALHSLTIKNDRLSQLILTFLRTPYKE